MLVCILKILQMFEGKSFMLCYSKCKLLNYCIVYETCLLNIIKDCSNFEQNWMSLSKIRIPIFCQSIKQENNSICQFQFGKWNPNWLFDISILITWFTGGSISQYYFFQLYYQPKQRHYPVKPNLPGCAQNIFLN